MLQTIILSILSNWGQATHDGIAHLGIASHDEAVNGQGVDS